MILGFPKGKTIFVFVFKSQVGIPTVTNVLGQRPEKQARCLKELPGSSPALAFLAMCLHLLRWTPCQLASLWSVSLLRPPAYCCPTLNPTIESHLHHASPLSCSTAPGAALPRRQTMRPPTSFCSPMTCTSENISWASLTSQATFSFMRGERAYSPSIAPGMFS